jgi:hypothetical protein
MAILLVVMAQELLIKQLSVVLALIERVVVNVVSIGDVVEDARLVRVGRVLVLNEWIVIIVLVNRVLVVLILVLEVGVLFILVELIKLGISRRGLLALFGRCLGGDLGLCGR